MTDEHRNAITLSAIDGWKKTIDSKEPSRNQVNLAIKSRRTLSRSLTILMRVNSYPTLPFKGRNIVDFDFMYKQLIDGHKPCNTTLSLTKDQIERLIGLTSIFYLSLQNCSTVTMVKTSIYDVNAKCVADK